MTKLADGDNMTKTDPIMILRNRMLMPQNAHLFRAQRTKDVAIGTALKAFNASIAKQSWTSKERNAPDLPVINGLKTIGTRTMYNV